MSPKSVAAVLRQIADRIDRSTNPSHSLVLKDIRSVVASLRTAEEAPPAAPEAQAAAAPSDQHTIEQTLYGHTADTDPYRGEGSSIWWKVFDDMDMADWIPTTDYSAVEKRAWELLNEWQPWKGMPEQQKYFQKEIDGLKRNWHDYQKHYMPEHVKLLKEKGLM